jgi:hypothetical protein
MKYKMSMVARFSLVSNTNLNRFCRSVQHFAVISRSHKPSQCDFFFYYYFGLTNSSLCLHQPLVLTCGVEEPVWHAT